MQGAENIENSPASNTGAWLRTILACLLLASLTAAVLPVAIVLWDARADLRGAIAGARLAADRTAALIGEPAAGEPVTLARLVATADGTVLLVRPVLEESAATVRTARQPLQAAAQTIHAARPVLGAAERAIDRTEAPTAAATVMLSDAGRAAKAAEVALVNANASWDDLYFDVKAGVESGTIAARGVAEASEAVGKAAPEITEAARVAFPRIADNTVSMTDDGRKVMRRMASPWTVVTDIAKKVWRWVF